MVVMLVFNFYERPEKTGRHLSASVASYSTITIWKKIRKLKRKSCCVHYKTLKGELNKWIDIGCHIFDIRGVNKPKKPMLIYTKIGSSFLFTNSVNS